MKNNRNHSADRRDFLKTTAAMGSLSLFPQSIHEFENMFTMKESSDLDGSKSIIGNYGPWADSLRESPAQFSFRNDKWKDIDAWRSAALKEAGTLISRPEIKWKPKVTVSKKYQYDGLDIEELNWQLPYGNRTEAILLKPTGTQGKLPGVLGLHDHGGNKYFGKRKITRTSDQMHPMMEEHQTNYYEGQAWANELAKKGYVVLVPDAFAFASRRVMFGDMSEIPWGQCATGGHSDRDPEEAANIEAYNGWAGEHEHILAKSLFCAGTTWPGVFLYEDQCALDVLSSRDDVDSKRLGCGGLSGGGLRTVYLGGMDDRIQCAVSVGFMSTWTDFLLNKSYTHTWMTYTPVLPKYLEFPEIFGLRAPKPTMTLNNNQDGLYTLPEMKKADAILKEVFVKADAADHYMGNFYDGDHKFDAQMQSDAFNWFDRWLK